MKVSSAYKLGKSQSQLDFVDVNTSKDTKLFIDPYAIEIRDDELCRSLKEHLVTYFETLLTSIKAGGGDLIANLTSHLSEPEETFLGVSKGAPAGRGIGKKQAAAITAALKRSQAFRTGQLKDLAETELFIEGISSDKLSDLTTNIIRYPLERYTKEQCELLGIPMRHIAMPAAWNPDTKRWEAHYADVPVVVKKPVLLVPKIIVRRKLSLDSQEFYNHYMLEYLREEEIRKGGSLVRILKTTKRARVNKKDLKERRPFSKPDLEKFAREHPSVLETYRKIKGAAGPLSASDFDEGGNEAAYAQALGESLKTIPPGMEAASQYHQYTIGLLSFLFYPDLTAPKKEAELHEGRKRIDIRYTNSSKSGFFYRMRTWPPASANYVFVECKNYSKDLANPELDQMSGRFGHQRGRLGLLLCRKIENKPLLRQRCKETASDGRGYIIALDDEDVQTMLQQIIESRRQAPYTTLDNILAQITS